METKSKTTLTVEWSSLKDTHHKAVFKKGVVGDRPCIKVMVETRQGREPQPCRVEIGLLGDILPALYSQRYRFMVGMEKTFEARLEALFDSESDEDLTDFGSPELGYTLHPVFREALRPFLNQGARA